MNRYTFDKIQNGQYFVFDNCAGYNNIGRLDINDFEILNYITEGNFKYLMKGYSYFDFFKKYEPLQQGKIDDSLMKSLNKEKKGNVVGIKGKEKLSVFGFYMPIDKLSLFMEILKKQKFKFFLGIDVNIFDPYIFLNLTINYFIDIILGTISSDSEKIEQYVKAFGIDINTIAGNMDSDSYFLDKSKINLQEDIYRKYFSLLANQKVLGLGNININLYIMMQEKGGYLQNVYPFVNDNRIMLKENLEFPAKTYVNLVDLLNNQFQPLSYSFWNLLSDKYLIIQDKLNYYYKEDIEKISNLILGGYKI